MNFIFRATLLLGFTFCNIKNEPQFFITVQEKLKGFEIKKEYPFIKEYSFSDSAVYYKLKIQNNTDSNFYVKCRNFGNMVHFEKIVNFKQLPDGKLNQLSISIGSNMNESAKLIKSHDSIILFTEYIITEKETTHLELPFEFSKEYPFINSIKIDALLPITEGTH